MKNSKKLLVVAIVLLLVMSIVASLTACVKHDCAKDGHRDANKDGVCDVCNVTIPAGCTHEDADHDGKCDKCGETVTPDHDCTTDGHVDANQDYKCDVCGEDMPLHDYVADLTLDMNTATAKYLVRDGSKTNKADAGVKNYVDGDTTHFIVPTSVIDTGVLKARYIAINTPESTGRIEEYGKKASNFTKERLKAATSILVESDTSNWDADSTGGRYMVWVWYKTSEDQPWRNLNLEILQNGLARASNTGGNRYGEICLSALAQAEKAKLNVFSGEQDPDFYYGEAVELSLKELRSNIEDYTGIKVAFEGNLVMDDNGTAYIEEYDEETDSYFGITVYYATANLSAQGNEIMTMGNRVRIVGTVEYWETGETYQVAGIQYKPRKPDDPSNIQKIGDGVEAAYKEMTANEFVNGKVEIQSPEDENQVISYDLAAMSLHSSVSMKGLKVIDVYTTTDPASSSIGAMTLTCQAADGTEIKIRTTVFKDEQGNVITEEAYMGKTIDVKGYIDYFNGEYQIKVFAPMYITVNP